MDMDRIQSIVKSGRAVGYSSKAYEGRGKIVRVHAGLTGEWVTVFDKERGKTVTVRPSQISR